MNLKLTSRKLTSEMVASRPLTPGCCPSFVEVDCIMNWALLKFSADKAQTKELRTKKKRRQEICNTIVFCDLTLKDENALRASSSILRESKPLSNLFLKYSRAAKNSGHPSGKKILYFCFKKI